LGIEKPNLEVETAFMFDWKKILLSPKASLEKSIKVLHEGGYRIALVVDEQNKLLGTVTDGAVRRNQPSKFVERYESRTPLGRMATEEDFKGVVAYLASDLSAYVTGQNIVFMVAGLNKNIGGLYE
jgi:enoyl-[acyl-carrier-protein] reductase (NADH)